MSLAVFDISKYVENGVVIEPVYDNMAGAIRYDDAHSSSSCPDNLYLAATRSHSSVLLNHAPREQYP
jgi:hypothetical protein